ncbi:MAG: 6-phosphogluconolactonase [Candidatus Sumerlaeaceae bacterium]|nr:6-phosphogluconolactonase [Candidatus Sumerlaeaceae bacterium]
MTIREIHVYPTAEETVQSAAALVLRIASNAVAQRGLFTVALAGGATPRALYSLLADNFRYRGGMPWASTQFFWSDERPVPPDHEASNYRMAHESMLSKVRVAMKQLHRMRGEDPDPDAAAAAYEAEIKTFFGDFGTIENNLPRFDLILLGLGTDGHTASLFPKTDVLEEKTALVAAPMVEKLASRRLTMTLPLINNAERILLLALGSEKAEIVKEVLAPSSGTEALPAQLVAPSSGRVDWFLDQPAAGRLPTELTEMDMF